MYYKFITFLIFCCLIFSSQPVSASDEECGPYDFLSQDFIKPLNNHTVALACCGKSKEEPGPYLSSQDKNYRHDTCLNRYKNGVPKSSDVEFGFLECVGASLSTAYSSLKESIASIWSTLTDPLSFLSDLTELGKMLVDGEGREKLYQFIKKNIENKMGNVKHCMSRSEIEEASCKLSGSFIANFVPPTIMVKAIVQSVKTGKATKEFSVAIGNTLNAPISKISTSSVNAKFSAEQILRHSKLTPGLRVSTFEKLVGAKSGEFSGNQAKMRAIINAHNMNGSLGKLTFSQIKERVSYLRKQGFTDKQIRIGLDAGIFGHVEAGPIDQSKLISSLPPSSASSLNSAKVLTKIPSTKFGSGQSLYSGDNNQGLEILMIGDKKVFSKIKYDPDAKMNFSPTQVRIIQDSFINESHFAKKLSDLGIGPKYYGSQVSSDGKYTIATEFVDGLEVHLGGEVKDIKDLKLGHILEMKQHAIKAVDHGIDPFDLQFRVSKDGEVFIIDPEHFSNLDPKRKGEVLKGIEDDFADLIKQKKLQKYKD